MPAHRDFWHVSLPLPPEVRRRIVETLRNHRAVEVGVLGHIIDPGPIEVVIGTCPDWGHVRDFTIQRLKQISTTESAFVLRAHGLFLSGAGRERSLWVDIDGDVDRYQKLEKKLLDALSNQSPKLVRDRIRRDRPGIFLLPASDLPPQPERIVEMFGSTAFGEIRVNGFLTEHVYTDPVRPEWNFRRRVAFFDFATSMLPNESLLSDPEPERRVAAIPFVAKQGAAAIPILITAFGDRSLPVRREVLRALGQLGRLNPSARRTVQAVLTRVAQTDASGEMRAHADEVLFALQAPTETPDSPPLEALRERFLAASPNDLLPLLLDHSKTFPGKPLQRTSWEVVSQAFAALPSRERLLPLLLTAQTRGDLTRLVAAARTSLEKRRRGAAGRAFAPQSQIQLGRASPVSAHDDLPNIWDLDGWEVNYYGDIWDEHRIYQRNHPEGPEHVFDPISPVEECVRNLYNRLVRRSVAPRFSSIEARIAPAQLAKLRKQIGGRLVVPPELLDLLGRCDLAQTWPALASQVGLGPEHPTVLPSSAHRVTSAEELAALSWYQEEGFAVPPHEVDWEKCLASIGLKLASPANSPVEVDHITRACFYTILTAEPETLRDFALALMTAHPDYAALFRLLLLRAPTLKSLLFGRFEKSAGSTLVVNLIVCNLHDGLRLTANQLLEYLDPAAPTDQSEPGEARTIRTLLLSGAGTLRRMDYPAFTLCCRPVLSEITREDEEELNALSKALADVHKTLQIGSDLDIYRTLLGAESILEPSDASPVESSIKALHTLM
ncbi:MAG: HEAT repeat domain-containing protein [Polyangiaceae bacterium]|nr:HEAT repeat domain-containing protein [Polyangiaceae bacterium]